jgi:DNA-binding transcriptional regulator YhcF (GntR family)
VARGGVEPPTFRFSAGARCGSDLPADLRRRSLSPHAGYRFGAHWGRDRSACGAPSPCHPDTGDGGPSPDHGQLRRVQKHPKVKTWLAANPRVHVHFTPTHAWRKNLVECWFSIAERRAIRRGTGDRPPPIAALQEHYGVPELNTIRQAEQLLVEDGLVETRQGVGAVVLRAEPLPRRADVLAGLRVARTAIKRVIAVLEASDADA